MRVSIRWRLMILLLGFGVLPLVLVTSMNRAGFRGVAKDVGTQISDTLIQHARRALGQITYEQVLLSRRVEQLIELSVRSQAREIEFRLAQPAGDAPQSITFASDFDNSETKPKGVTTTPRYFPKGPEGTPPPPPPTNLVRRSCLLCGNRG